jgi:hypothetical protein
MKPTPKLKCLSFAQAGLQFGIALSLSWAVLALWEGSGAFLQWCWDAKIALAIMTTVGTMAFGGQPKRSNLKTPPRR